MKSNLFNSFIALLYLLLILQAGSQNLSAQPQKPLFIMKDVLNNQNKLIFEGEKTILFETNKKTTPTIVKVYRSGSKERLEYISDASHPYHIIISNDISTYYLQPDNKMLIEKNLEIKEDTNLKSDRIKLAFENYEWKIIRQERFLGQDAVVIDAMPYKHKDRFYRFWVDSKNKLILKKEQHNKKDSLKITTQFTAIKFVDSLPEKLFAVDTAGGAQKQKAIVSTKIPIEEINSRVGFAPKLLKELPNGYSLEGVYLETNRGKQRLRFAYSDGIETISLFETKQNTGHNNRPISSSSGKTSNNTRKAKESHWKMLSWNDNQITYTLIGTISADALEQIAVFIHGGVLGSANKTTSTKKIFNYFKRGLKQLFGDSKELGIC